MQPKTVIDDSAPLLSTLRDRLQIRDVILRAAMAIPTRDAASLLTFFAEDARVLGYPEGLELSPGEYVSSVTGAEWDGRQQVITNLEIDLDGDVAIASSMFIDTIAPDPAHRPVPTTTMTAGRFVDRVARIDDEWRITQRQIEVDWAVAGDAEILGQFRAAGGTTADVLEREQAIAEQRTALDEQSLIDRQNIADQIARLARGVDRLDLDVFTTHFDDSMTMAFGSIEVPGSTFVGMSSGDAPNRYATQHAVSNVVIAVDGDEALSSTHLFGVISYRPGFGPAFIKERNSATGGLLFSGCRYLDRWQRVTGGWRLVRRDLVQEWTGRFDNTAMADFAASPASVGTRDLGDPSYGALLPVTQAGDLSAVADRESIAEAIIKAEAGAAARHVLTQTITVAGSRAIVEAYRLFARVGNDGNVRLEGGRELLTVVNSDGSWRVTDITLIPEWRTVAPDARRD